MRLTPPPPCLLALIWPCVLRTAIFWPRVLSIKVCKTVVVPNALYGSELWSSMIPAYLRKLEHFLSFCLKHMQGLPRRTPTNFTLSAINAVPIKTVIDHKNWTFLDNCVPFHAHIWLNASSTSGLHIFNTWTPRVLVSFLIITEYWPSMLYTMYLIAIYQIECLPLSVHWKESFMKRLSNEVTFFMNVLRTIPLALHLYCVLMVWAVYGPWPDNARNCRLFAEGQWG